jgi:hypothetical protein
MKRTWTTPMHDPALDWSAGWTCQLVNSEVAAGRFVLDFVALEAAPAGGAVVDAGTPFTIHVEGSGPPGDVVRAVSSWAAAADLVTIFSASNGSRSWWRLSAADAELLLLG